ncbi:hypothetical protein [Yoonia sp. BS5-3]|uniref:AlgX/AlgJ SGNH hydrolase-like domain-containing protein n=1 Tax=Yoonia phaeophyticola TaxID=3137369 RepID=A0ABZ2V7H8_9RHOB
MMITTAIRLTAPLAFFGYAAFANLSLLQGDVEGPDAGGFLKGEFSQELDTLYRTNLPHREVAVGWVGMARYALLNEGRDGVVPGSDDWLFSSEEFRSHDPDTIKLNDTLDYMSQVHMALQAMGSELVIVPLPAKIDVARSYAPSADQINVMSAAYDQFLTDLDTRGIKAVDTRPALVAADQPFFQTDTHWTDSGALAVAGAVAASGLIATGNTEFTRTDQAPVSFAGDLVAFVTSETLGPIVGLHSETITPYVAESATGDTGGGGIDLFGNSGPKPVDLVGTSYSANTNWSFAEALKLSLAQDVLNHAEEGQGPVAPMHAYLENLDPADAPPAVIWEFPVRYLSDPKLMDALTDEEEASDENA